ncbi:MAG: hypothetical protein ACJ8C4_21165 [Gemmataceae bacterium]
MVSRTTARKWKSVAISLALLPAISAVEGRLLAQSSPAPISAVRDAGPSAAKGADATRELLRKARAAFQSGDFAAAEKYAKEAQNQGSPLPFWEGETPERMLADIINARAKAAPNADPKLLLKNARESLTAGRFDEAQALASKANASNTRWGMFDDNPNKCLDDLQKARSRAEKLESARLLTEARKCYDNGKLDEAEGMCYRAERLHGNYSVWDGNDKPQKLLSDIQTARAKNKKSGPALARTDDKAAPAPTWNEDTRANKSDILRVSGTANTAMSPTREQAKLLMAEGKSAMRAGKLVEARAKFMEAQKLNAEFKPDEENPIRCLNDLMMAVNKQVRDAVTVNCGPNDPPANREACQQKLNNAMQLATDFGLDTRPIEAKLSSVQAAAAVVDNAALGKGLIDKARVEIQNGQLEVARQLAIEAYNGPYKCQAEAANVLRQIDAAEKALQPAEQAPAPLPAPVMPVAAPVAQEPTPMLATPPAPMMQPTPPRNLIPSQTAPAAPQDSLAGQMRALQKIEYQRLREEGQKAQSEAIKLFERGETDLALDTLEAYLTKVKQSQLEANEIVMLQRPVENRLQNLKMVKGQKDAETKVTSRKTKHDAEMARNSSANDRLNEQIKELWKQHGQLWKEGKYAEAKVVAAKIHELNPDDPALASIETITTAKANLNDYEKNKKASETTFVNAMNAIQDPGPAVTDKDPLKIDPLVSGHNKDRGTGNETINLRNHTPAEREIQYRLTLPSDLSFQNSPLRQVIDDIRTMTGLNIVVETTALEEEHISLEQPVTIKLDGVRLEYALKNLLAQVHLTTVISDDVLKVTTEKRARGRMVQRVYRVADLVMPIEDYVQPNSMNLQKALDRVVEAQSINLRGGQTTPSNNGRFQLGEGTPVSSNGQPTLTTSPGANQPQTSMSPIGATTMAKQTMQDMLIKLIQNTVAPQSWSEVGGSGTVEYMPIGMALIINQTTDVQEQVEQLLEALRRLQDLQVSVEIKLITLSETFFERIGLDFNLNLKTDKSTSRFEPQITSGQFKPAGQVNDFSPNRMVAGLSPAGNGGPGNFTSDLDIPIRSSSFQYGIPPFAYPNNPGFDGGLSMGLAFLSEIQVFMFMEAAQGDRRIHVMQAPKLTLFNGQSSNMSVQDQQFFVTNVGVVGFGGQMVFVPQNNPFPLGVEMTLQAVVSADRRFVRMNINQRLANLASANVPLFPVTTFITPVFEGGAQGQPIPFTQFIQQPQLSLISIQTTVSVPDGGTVIIGGLKTLSEGRNEFGPPVLSKLPYVNRLFRNSGFGREAQSLLMMVTPRVIINSEEEIKQTGYNSMNE